jgi:hypothetical protein
MSAQTELQSNPATLYTAGPWQSEADSAAALDAALARCDLWRVYKEVPGTLVQPRPVQQDRSVRIDRILVPGETLRNLGWTQGVVGIEIKRSGIKANEALAQCLDYGRSVFTLPTAGIDVWLKWVFLWPLEKTSGVVASILAQNRIGTAYAHRHCSLHLCSGETALLYASADLQEVRIGKGSCGQKTGSR